MKSAAIAKILNIIYISVFLLGICAIVGNGLIIGKGIYNNIAHILLARAWLTREIDHFEEYTFVRDNIPDDWVVSNWGHSTQEQSLDFQQVCEGYASFIIQKNNSMGAASLYQIVQIEPGAEYSLSLCSKGDGGQIIITPLDTQGEYPSENTTRFQIPPSTKWEKHDWEISFQEPFSSAQIWIAVYQKNASTWVDQMNIHSNNQTNIFNNPGFENDGHIINSLPTYTIPTISILDHKIELTSADDDIWYRNKAQINYLHGDYDLLTGDLEEIVNNNSPDNTRFSGWIIGEIHKQIVIGNLGLAQQLTEIYISIDPSNPLVNELLGDIYKTTGSNILAINAYQSAQPDNNPRVAHKLGILYLTALGDKENAIKYLKLAQENQQIAKEVLRWMDVQLQVGIEMLNKGDYDDAEDTFSLILALTPATSPLNIQASNYHFLIQTDQ